MATLSKPSEIARETLKTIAVRKLVPTPDIYAQIYQEMSGETAAPASVVKSNTMIQPGVSNAPPHDISWSNLIRDLLRQIDIPHKGITLTRKKEGVETVLSRFTHDPFVLHEKLQNLLRSWGSPSNSPNEVPQGSELISVTASPSEPVGKGTAGGEAAGSSHELLSQLRELLAQTLDNTLHTHPDFSNEIQALVQQVRSAGDTKQITDLANQLRKFWLKLELRGGDKVKIQEGLLRLLRLLVENVSELVADDQWMHGQISTLQDLVEQPLDKHAIADAERHLRNAIIKQSTLKQSLNDAKSTLKSLMTTFIDRLGELTESTGDYHSKIVRYSQKIGGADNITELSHILSDIMQDTRVIQASALRSHEELLLTRKQANEAEERANKLELALEQVSELVREDQLTGALNRRGMEETLEREFKQSGRAQTMLSVALLDLDNFKQVNDNLGHQVGDEVLIHLTQVIKEALRPSDSVARYGGEEFLIILPNTDMEEAMETIERLQRELTKKFFLHNNERKLITFSAGVALRMDEEDKTDLIGRADKAMYHAKKTGKNRVVAAT